jgi:hypothetical protein
MVGNWELGQNKRVQHMMVQEQSNWEQSRLVRSNWVQDMMLVQNNWGQNS